MDGRNERGPGLLSLTPDWAVCVKPAGTESEREMPEWLSRTVGGEFRPVHRLDRNVGGVMIYARNARAAAALSALIRDGQMEKEYVAGCRGSLPPEGRMEDLLWKDPKQNKVYVVRRERGGVRRAALRYRVLGQDAEGVTLVLVRLETGRSHQIRVQFASRGCPLAGDRKYGARDGRAMPMLYSCRISFPWQGRQVSFRSWPDWAGPCPEEE